jgi:hypothetical protein
MARAIYTADTEGVVAVAAAATKTVFAVKADTGHAIDLLALNFSLDQATPTASDKGVFIELCAATFATNAPGTNSTAVGVDQAGGPRIAETFAAGKNWTTEPTVLTSISVAEGFALRITNPSGNQSVNVRAWAKWARV